jgi:HAMP domain-containing protein
MYHGQLEQNAQQTALQLNRLFQAALENAMLKRDIDGLREIVRRLGTQDRIAAVMILHPSGEVRFSSDSRMLGRRLAANNDIHADLGNGSWGNIRFITDMHGQEVLRSAIAVPNRDECFGCHGSKSINPINGVLIVDHNAAPIRQHARETTLALMGAGSIVVLVTLLGGWWFMRRFVLRPVAALTRASQDLALGKRDSRVLLHGKDELSQLAETFNRMADDIDASLRAKQENEAFLQAVIDGIPDGIRRLSRHQGE